MKLNDELSINPTAYGIFSIKSYDKDNNVIDDYIDNNLIVYTARAVMAGRIADLTSTGDIEPINKFVLGTRGHIGDNVLVPVEVGEEQPGFGLFDPYRSELYSEESGEYNYHVSFNPEGGLEVTRDELTGEMREGKDVIKTDTATNTVKREVTGVRENEVKYIITIETQNANIQGEAVPYTEAALYAGENLFAMKTFPARVKENTVKFVITWSIIF